MSDMHIDKVIRAIQDIRRQSENLTEAVWRDPSLEESFRKECAMSIMRIQETFTDVLADIAEVVKKHYHEVHDDN